MNSNFLKALGGTRLYPLTDRKLSGLSHVEQVLQLSDAGVKIVQLREKFLPPREFYQQAEAALRVARARDLKIIVNDRVDIALALNADGVHLGQDDMPLEAARRLLGSEAIIGLSTHTLEQVRLATKLPIDYLAIGPIFATDTKQSSKTPIGLEGLQAVRQAIGQFPLVAIGGITIDRAENVVAAGADAVALISDLWTPGPIAARAEHLLRI